jgi:hypothetical protein
MSISSLLGASDGVDTAVAPFAVTLTGAIAELSVFP